MTQHSDLSPNSSLRRPSASSQRLNRRQRRRGDGVARVVVVVGGTFAETARRPECLGATLVAYADVGKEHEESGARADVVKVHLAPGHTLASMVEQHGADEAVRHILETCPAIDLEVGLAQEPDIGRLVAEALVGRPDFEDFLLNHVLDPLIRHLNGVPRRVDLVLLASMAGGTGSAVGPVLVEAIKQVLLAYSDDVVVRETYLRVGSLSFTGLGRRVHDNAARTLEADKDYMTSVARHAREVRRLFITELPITSHDRDQRTHDAAELAQALFATEVQSILDRWAPDAASTGRLGNVRLLRPAFGQHLPAALIASDAGAQYLEPLRALADTPAATDIVRGFSISLDTDEQALESIDAMVRAVAGARGVEPAGLMESWLRAPIHTGGRVRVNMRDLPPASLDGDDLRFTPGETRAEIAKNLGTMAAIRAGLAAEVATRVAAVQVERRRLESATAELRRVAGILFPRDIMARLRRALGSPERRAADLRRALSAAQQSAAKLARVEAEVELLRSARHWVDGQYQTERRRIEDVLAIVRRVVIGDAGRAADTYVEALPFDEVFPDLLRTAVRPEHADPIAILDGCAARVTLRGLQRITGADEPLVARIAARLALDWVEKARRAPAWGGNSTLPPSDVIVVLPPISEADERDLREAFKIHGDGSLLAVGDSAAAGANVVRIEVARPAGDAHVQPAFVRTNLARARNGDAGANGRHMVVPPGAAAG